MTLAVGDMAPDFTLKNQFGEDVTLSSFRGKQAVVLVFFPLAFTGICTGELCELRDNMAAFQSDNVALLGISVDSHFTHRVFAEREGYDFSLLSDFWPHGGVATDYGVFIADKGIATRATFVIDIEGRIADSFVTDPGTPRDLGRYRDALTALSA